MPEHTHTQKTLSVRHTTQSNTQDSIKLLLLLLALQATNNSEAPQKSSQQEQHWSLQLSSGSSNNSTHHTPTHTPERDAPGCSCSTAVATAMSQLQPATTAGVSHPACQQSQRTNTPGGSHTHVLLLPVLLSPLLVAPRCCCCAVHAAAAGVRPACLSRASVEGSRPRNILNTSAGGLLPPRASTVSLQQQQQQC